MNGNEGDAKGERGTPEGSFDDSNASLEMEEETRRTSIFKYYSYRNTGESPNISVDNDESDLY